MGYCMSMFAMLVYKEKLNSQGGWLFMMNKLMQKIQRFGGAMFTPVLLFAFSGIVVGIATVFQSEVIMGSLAAPDTTWWQIWHVVREAAWTVFRQVPILFVISLPIGLAKKQHARAAMEAFVLYITFNYALASMLTHWGTSWGVDISSGPGNGTGLTTIANILTLDTGMVGALVIAGIVIYLHNKYFDTNLPDWLGIFKGSSFICIIGFPVMIALAFIFMVVWPQVQILIAGMQSFFIGAGNFGIFVYIFLERILIPTGLHHFVYMPFMFDSVVVEGGIHVAWAEILPTIVDGSVPLRELFPAGGFSLYGLSKIFAPLGITMAFYKTAKPNKKKIVLGLMIPATITAVLTGITEPLEFTFLFVAPILFFVHALLAATLSTVSYALGLSGLFASGVLQFLALNWLPLGGIFWRTYLMQFIVGFSFTGIWYFVFKYLIVKLNLKTPGRESDDEDTKLFSKADYKAKKTDTANNDPIEDVKNTGTHAEKAKAFLAALGGKENILDVTNCATRLRVTVKDVELMQPQEAFKKVGAHGLVANKEAIQIIVGLNVPHVRDEFENLL